ncbi:carbohydrate ABC transporter permease [Auraticoccus monumenti]|uniref:Multiple sugar transport system permease protein n=1 Tax=Auraticoccus monumenti TaxID=675864 RepID=A0A1G6Y8S1_9ACTN|nr:carbohydrate ABC transporter permease [Auraticoccus monumenti]SDD85976.1 multiple sugar transport system permease protein [Auraticoccus monumenti]
MSTTSTDLITPPVATPPPRRRRPVSSRESERSILSALDRRRPAVRWGVGLLGALVLVLLAVVCAGPLLWLFKAATSTSTETLAQPFALWPSGVHWENFSDVWTRVEFRRYFLNTIALMAGSLFFGLLVATTGGYGLAVLKPRYAKVVSALVLATLFIPGVISLVSLYLTVVRLPVLGISLIGTLWAVWLPSAANAVNVLLMQRFFASIPAELFEAARIDGAGPLRIFVAIVLPMSKPILGVISLLTLVSAYKEFLWPLLVLPRPADQPISVVLPRLEGSTDYALFLAALFISVLVPVVLFLLFQRQFLRAAGNAGALKG